MAQSLVQIMESRPDMIASPSIESDPVVTALSLETGIPFVCIHGGKILYGEVQKRSLVDVVADVTLTGETALSTVKTIKDLGRVGKVYAVVDLEEGAKEKLAAEGVELIPLIRVKEL
jgi:orotate phosphoribosyltransferase